MTDKQKTKQELIQELDLLRQRVASVEQSELARKRAEEALLESDARYERAVNGANDGIWEWIPSTGEDYLSPRWKQLLGYEDHELPNVQASFFDQIHPEDKPRLLEAVRAHFEEHKPFAIELRLRCKNGEYRWFYSRGQAVWDEQGQPLRMAGSITDITERGRAEAALRESERRYKRITEGLTDYQYTVRVEDGRAVETRQGAACARVTGYTAEEFAANPYLWLQMVPPEDREQVQEGVQQILAGNEVAPMEHRIVRKDGETRWVRDTVILDRDAAGKLLSYDGVIKDITEHKRAGEVLRKSEEEAKRLAQENEVMAEIGRVISSSLNIEEVYERFADLVKPFISFDRIAINIINPEDNTATVTYVSGIPMEGCNRGDVYSLAGSTTEEVRRTWSSLLLQPQGPKGIQEVIGRYPGLLPAIQSGIRSMISVPLVSRSEVIGVLHFRSPKPNAYSEKDMRFCERVAMQISGAIANAQLFAERKKAEEEKRSLEERLQRSEKMEALGILAGGVAHDLNNVLGIVVGYAELVLMDADQSSSIRPHLLNIMKGGQRAAAIVDDLLTLARRGVSGRSILNLNKIITDCQQSPEFAKLSDYHPSVKIKTDLDPDLLNISGSSVHLGKTLFNLVSNACEAMAKGGVVTMKTANQYLDKPMQGYDNIREGDYVVLSVSDTGEGIAANDLKRIFEPFYTKKVMGRSGTGLGLAVVWGTAKDHNGYIDVQSEEGKGSIFTLYFLVTREEISAEAVAIAISEYAGKGESILVVDDVKEQRDLASGMLRTLNYNVSSGSSGEEAVAYLKEHTVDLMVLDMIMNPGMDGLDTYKRVLEINPHQKVILVSGYSESDRVKEAQRLGAGAYVKKPYVLERIGVAIRDELLKDRTSKDQS